VYDYPTPPPALLDVLYIEGLEHPSAPARRLELTEWRAGTCHQQTGGGADDQLTNAVACLRFGASAGAARRPYASQTLVVPSWLNGLRLFH
jgi:hypothetical protein